MDEVTLLREIADAAADVDIYEDFSQPILIHCAPAESDDFNNARLRLYKALKEYREWQTAHLPSIDYRRPSILMSEPPIRDRMFNPVSDD